MKQALFFATLLIILGIAGFLYRNSLEAPKRGTNATVVACPTDAKLCADGSSVGRTGPSCQFDACKLPSIELPQIGISFVLPVGFARNQSTSGDSSLIAAFEKSMMSDPKDTIVVRRYAIPEGKDANEVMLTETMYESSGNQPKSMTEFTPVIINGKTFQTITVERFEAQVHTLYYLPREKDVIRFEAVDHHVTNWTDPTLDITSLPTQKALQELLGTSQGL